MSAFVCVCGNYVELNLPTRSKMKTLNLSKSNVMRNDNKIIRNKSLNGFLLTIEMKEGFCFVVKKSTIVENMK